MGHVPVTDKPLSTRPVSIVSHPVEAVAPSVRLGLLERIEQGQRVCRVLGISHPLETSAQSLLKETLRSLPVAVEAIPRSDELLGSSASGAC